MWTAAGALAALGALAVNSDEVRSRKKVKIMISDKRQTPQRMWFLDLKFTTHRGRRTVEHHDPMIRGEPELCTYVIEFEYGMR